VERSFESVLAAEFETEPQEEDEEFEFEDDIEEALAEVNADLQKLPEKEDLPQPSELKGASAYFIEPGIYFFFSFFKLQEYLICNRNQK